jgi:hypothetical protein
MRTYPGNPRLDDLFFMLTIIGFAISLIAGGITDLNQRVETRGISEQYRTPTQATHREKTRVDVGGTRSLSKATAAAVSVANPFRL